ncbi:MAG TPA: DNA repair protein RadC, partial [Planctomycetes bacterium]|nr:DNA repair protein RadC [Planctomycetota bacterium]
ELARRIQATRAAKRPTLRTPRRVFDLLHARLADLEQETFLALHLDGKHRLRALRLVSIGTLTTSLVHPREVFRDAVRSSAAALIVVHNHPSGDPEPSGEDLAVTRRLQASGDLLGIPLLDHVILAANSFLSLRTRMDFDAKPRPSEVRGASTCRSCG